MGVEIPLDKMTVADKLRALEAIWTDLLRTPDDVLDALVGVVQNLIRQDPVLGDWLREAWARWLHASQGGDARARGTAP